MTSPQDSEDEQLKRAIELSLQDQAMSEEQDRHHKPNNHKVADGGFELKLLERKKMEEERLARLAAKRNRQMCVADNDDVKLTAQKRRRQVSVCHSSVNAEVPYPDGTVKRTWARGYDRSGDDIMIEEVLQKDSLLLAFFSSFQWDETWLLSKIDASQTRILLAASAVNDSQEENMRRNAPSNVKFCFPKMHGPGCMHSKLQLLKFPDYLRIVIPTGNLVPYDWGETGVMENMVFIIDLPPLSLANGPTPNGSTSSTLFYTQLQLYIRAMGVGEGMAASLSKYDFAKTAELGFVYSIPGVHLDSSLPQVGFTGLGSTIKALGLSTTACIEVDFACSSLGAIKEEFVRSIYNACRGTVGEGQVSSKQNAQPNNEPRDMLQLQQYFRIYFPSHNTVLASRGGINAAGTICIQEKWWQAATFPRELVRDCVNTRNGLLMHSKLILVRHGDPVGRDTVKKQAWAYVGSANLSESAWGRKVRDKATGQQKIICRNWECGVVIPVRTSSEQGRTANTDIFSGTVPVPMHIPGRRYSREEHPWFFQRS